MSDLTDPGIKPQTSGIDSDVLNNRPVFVLLNTMDCGAYRGVKLLEHAMKMVERVLENRIREFVMIDEMQFGFMPGKRTTQALFILRMQEEFRGREKVVHVF